MTEVPPLHPGVAAIGALVGAWSGAGQGEYSTIEPFDYVETIEFTHVGKPFLAYRQRTRRLLADGTPGEPLHAEAGYWRCPTPDSVEIVLAHPTGITEIQEGTLDVHDDGLIVIALASSTIAGTVTAKRVDAVERTFRLTGDHLGYRLAMAAVGQPLQHHLAADLRRLPA